MQSDRKKVLVTGADGFIGRNVIERLKYAHNIEPIRFVRGDSTEILSHLIAKSDAIIHLAGENRPQNAEEFYEVNTGLTEKITQFLKDLYDNTGRQLPLVFASSTQVKLSNPYGKSKLAAEELVCRLNNETKNPCTILRLPGVFGKWCKPNYNSVVATFCYNVSRDLPIQISDPEIEITLVHIDDVIDTILSVIFPYTQDCNYVSVDPKYKITLGELVKSIRSFKEFDDTLLLPAVGIGFVRKLYSTYISYLPTERFSHKLVSHKDHRGTFVEMLKTHDCGQFSYFTAYPGVTRGGHFHNIKTEKFLVVKGKAKFRFRNLVNDEKVELCTSGDIPEIVDTIPGWVHDVTNIGSDELIVMLLAN